MKKYIYLILVGLFFTTCGEQDVITYDVVNGDTLIKFESNSTLILLGTGTESTVLIPISVSTYSDSERTISVAVEAFPDGSGNVTAQPEDYSFDGTVVIPANELIGNLEFTGINTDGFDQARQLQLRIVGSSIDNATIADSIHTINLDSEPVLWTGPMITFVYDGGGDNTLEENQDRITDNVWIVRGPNFPIYNAARESQFVFGATYPESLSPAGTEWAIGSLSDGIENLNFNSLAAVTGATYQYINNQGNRPMVVHLLAEDIYFDLVWIDWHRGNGNDGGLGGFSYMRSTPEE